VVDIESSTLSARGEDWNRIKQKIVGFSDRRNIKYKKEKKGRWRGRSFAPDYRVTGK
jgi:hypothetical protein